MNVTWSHHFLTPSGPIGHFPWFSLRLAHQALCDLAPAAFGPAPSFSPFYFYLHLLLAAIALDDLRT